MKYKREKRIFTVLLAASLFGNTLSVPMQTGYVYAQEIETIDDDNKENTEYEESEETLFEIETESETKSETKSDIVSDDEAETETEKQQENEKDEIAEDKNILHIGHTYDLEVQPDYSDEEKCGYDEDIELDKNQSKVRLFADRDTSKLFSEDNLIKWSIIRGEKETKRGTANISDGKDDWEGFEEIEKSPKFTVEIDSDKSSSYYGSIVVAACENKADDDTDYDYYIRAEFEFVDNDVKYNAITTVKISVLEDNKEDDNVDDDNDADNGKDDKKDTDKIEKNDENINDDSNKETSGNKEDSTTEIETKTQETESEIQSEENENTQTETQGTVETIETETIETETIEIETVETETEKTTESIEVETKSEESSEITITGFERESDKLTYTGGKITQDIKVYYKGKQLKEKTDYTITYKNNINAATYKSKNAPSVTVTMKGQYSGSKTMYFTIAKRNINEDGMQGYEQVLQYSANLKITAPTVYFNNKKLVSGNDFECDYSNLPKNYTKGDSYEEGKSYEYTVSGINNFTGSFTMKITVINNKQLDFNNATITLDKKQYEYHNEALSEKDININSVKIGKTVLESELFEYKVYAENVGTGYVEVYPSEAGRDKGYRGAKKITVKIVGDRKISEASLGDSWNGEIVFSQAKLNSEGGILQKGTDILYYNNSGNSEYLIEGEDYTIQYKNNTKVGTATVIFTGKGRYTGSLKKTYKIIPSTNLCINWYNTDDEGNPVAFYVKGSASTEFDLTDNNLGTYILKNKTDYSFSMKYNKITGKATCDIVGKGNYKGYKKSVELEVTAGDISRASVTVADKLYSTKENSWKSSVTIKDINGKKLVSGQDYDSNVVYTYEGMEQGIAPQTGTVINVTIYGINNYAGSYITANYHIYNSNISKLIFVIDSQEYTGEDITLTSKDIHVYASKTDAALGNEMEECCYEIVGYANNVNTGTAKITLKGIGNYSGTKTYSFKITPKNYVEIVEDIKVDGEYVTPQMFKNETDTDDTASFNRAINSLSGSCKTLYVPAGEYYIDADVSVHLKSNMNLVMSRNAKIKALGNSFRGYNIIKLNNVNNITITGGQIIGERYEHTGSIGEWGMGIGVYDSNNIKISDVTISDCWGDGIYLGSDNEADSSASSKYITIENCTLKNNRRNNLSIVCADYVTINDCSFDKANGTAPEYGICIEPNYATNPNEHITISNSTFNDNSEAAIGIVVISNDITITDCVLNGDVINYAGTNVSISKCTINGNLYARSGVNLDKDTVINNGSSKQDKLVASFNANQGDFSVYEKYVNDSNKMSYSIVDDSTDSNKTVLKLERTADGTSQAGYYLQLGEITNNKMTSLKANTTYRFEYTVKGTGRWKFQSSQTSGYECIPMSDKFSTAIVTYQTRTNGRCDLIFYAMDITSGIYLEIESINVYEVY